MTSEEKKDVRRVLQAFQDAYLARDLSRLENVMKLFLDSEEIELIGIGAKERNGYEWFQGKDAIKGIIAGDWEFWGDVRLDVENARIFINGKTAWLSTTGTLTQSTQHEKAMVEFAKMMHDMLDDIGNEGEKAEKQMMEAAHYGIRRLREKSLGEGYQWPFTFTSVLVKDGENWKFHTIHWAMPVD